VQRNWKGVTVQLPAFLFELTCTATDWPTTAWLVEAVSVVSFAESFVFLQATKLINDRAGINHDLFFIPFVFIV
jgi:hypothetical protein